MSNMIILLVIFINSFSRIFNFLLTKSNAKEQIPIRKIGTKSATKVDKFWRSYTVFTLKWNSAPASRLYYKWLTNYYPLLGELMEYNVNFANKIVLDYGCGTGNDLFRLTVINKAKKVIGTDVSYKALDVARRRLMIHGIDEKRCLLLRITDSTTTLPLATSSVDFINCAGVLMHASHPKKILKEFYRVLKKGGSGIIMVYNFNSIWLHLFVPYIQMILKGRYKGLSVVQVFSKTTDGENCPIARVYKPKEFITTCESAGFAVEYRGGYFSADVLGEYHKYIKKALKDRRLANLHKSFLKDLIEDKNGYPMYQGDYAGVHGVYKIFKN